MMMRQEITKSKKLACVIFVSCFLLILAIAIGATGPKSQVISHYSAFQCPNGVHVWNAACIGIRPAYNESWVQEFDPVKKSNRYWGLEITPITANVQPDHPIVIPRTINILFSIWGKKNQEDSEWHVLDNKDYNIPRSENLFCWTDRIYCQSFVALSFDNLDFSLYKVSVTFTDLGGVVSPVGDVLFTYYTGNSKFATMTTLVSLFFLLVSVILCGLTWYLILYRQQYRSDLAYEQKFLFFLTLGLLLYNNPLFYLKWMGTGWFWTVLDSLFKVIFLVNLFFFWKSTLRKLNSDSTNSDFPNSRNELLHYIDILVFFILALITDFWLQLRLRFNQILGLENMDPLFFFFVILTVLSLLFTISLLGSLAYQTKAIVDEVSSLQRRFYFIILPGLFVTISILSKLLSGSLLQSGVAVLYYSTICNVYVYFMIWAYWPVKAGFSTQNPYDYENTNLIS